MFSFKQIHPGVFHLEFESAIDVAAHFLRFQEFQEKRDIDFSSPAFLTSPEHGMGRKWAYDGFSDASGLLRFRQSVVLADRKAGPSGEPSRAHLRPHTDLCVPEHAIGPSDTTSAPA